MIYDLDKEIEEAKIRFTEWLNERIYEELDNIEFGKTRYLIKTIDGKQFVRDFILIEDFTNINTHYNKYLKWKYYFNNNLYQIGYDPIN